MTALHNEGETQVAPTKQRHRRTTKGRSREANTSHSQVRRGHGKHNTGQVRQVRPQQKGTRDSNDGTRNQGLGTRDQERGTRITQHWITFLEGGCCPSLLLWASPFELPD